MPNCYLISKPPKWQEMLDNYLTDDFYGTASFGSLFKARKKSLDCKNFFWDNKNYQ